MNQTTLDLTKFVRKPRKNGNRNERYYALTCGLCGGEYHLRLHDARKAVAENRACSHCNQKALAKAGYAACVRKHGVDFTLKFVTEYQLAHPSKPEQQIIKWLDELGVKYQRQVTVDLGNGMRYIVDFFFDNGKAIEAAGGFWHAKNKQSKDSILATILNVLFINDDVIMQQPDVAFAKISAFVRS